LALRRRLHAGPVRGAPHRSWKRVRGPSAAPRRRA